MKKSTALTLILILIVLGQFAIDVYLPSLPVIAQQFSVSPTLVQYTLTLYMLSFALSQIFYGPISDDVGRKPVLLFGITLFFVSSLFCSIAPNLWVLLAGRFFQGLGAGAVSCISRAMMRDHFEGKALARVSSYLGMVWACVPIIAPMVGGYVQTYFGWTYVFVTLAMVSAALFTYILFALQETREVAVGQFSGLHLFRAYQALLSTPHYLSCVVSLFILFGCFMAFNVVAPFLIEVQLHHTPKFYGWCALIVALGYLFGTYGNSRLLQDYEIEDLTRAGFNAAVAVTVGFVVVAFTMPLTLWSILLFPFLLFFCLGFIYPNCLAKAIMPYSTSAGAATALLGVLSVLGGCFISFVMAHLPETTAKPLALVFLVQVAAAIPLQKYSRANCLNTR